MKCPGLRGVQTAQQHLKWFHLKKAQARFCARLQVVSSSSFLATCRCFSMGSSLDERRPDQRSLWKVQKLCGAGQVDVVAVRAEDAFRESTWVAVLSARRCSVHGAGHRCQLPRPKHAESGLAALWNPIAFPHILTVPDPWSFHEGVPASWQRDRRPLHTAHLDSHCSQSVFMNCWLKTRSLSETPPAEKRQAQSIKTHLVLDTASRHAVHRRSFLASLVLSFGDATVL